MRELTNMVNIKEIDQNTRKQWMIQRGKKQSYNRKTGR